VNAEPTARHFTSHRSVLKPAPAAMGAGSLDAVVMPAARPAGHLLHGMELAVLLGCEFVALCSGQAQLPEAAGLAREVPGLSWTLVELPTDWTSGLLDFRTSRFPAATALRRSDLSTKRNIGLLLARMAGWKRILFLDDDIRLDAALVREAAATLRPGRATGMRALDFPDNSVVSHALRILYPNQQDVFVSGSALLVDTSRIDSYFPDIYNEDWFFLFDAVRLGMVSQFGEVHQQDYDPFKDSCRAAREEFGDVLAEGLMSLLHYAGGKGRAFTEGYWEAVLDQRIALLESTAGLLDAKAPSAAGSVRAAAAETKSFTGALLARYVRQWQRDVRLWQSRIETLGRAPSLDAALCRLRLPHITKRSGQVEPESFLAAQRITFESLALTGATKAKPPVEPVGVGVAIDYPQPHLRNLEPAQMRDHVDDESGRDAFASGRRSDPEGTQVAIGGRNVVARRRTQKRLRLRLIIVFRSDQPYSERQLGAPVWRPVLAFRGERGQKRRRRLAQGVESR